MKKLIILLLVLTGMVGVDSADGMTFYLYPNDWTKDGAVLAIKYVGSGNTGTWYSLTGATDGIYTVTVDDGTTGWTLYRFPNGTASSDYGTTTSWNTSDNMGIADRHLYVMYSLGSTGAHDYNLSTLSLKGSFNGANWDNEVSLVKGTGFVFSGTIDLSSLYSYNPEFKLYLNNVYKGYNEFTLNAHGWVPSTTDHANCTLSNSTTIYKTYTATVTWSPSADPASGWTVSIDGKDVKTFPATISSSGYGTLSNASFALDFSSFTSNFTAYLITGATDKATLSTTSVADVPANTGVLLHGTAGSYEIPVMASSSTVVSSNLLKPGTGELLAQHVGTGEDTKYNYILTKNAGGEVKDMKFYLVNSAGNTVPVGKAYLQIGYSDAGLASNPGAGAPSFFNIDFGDGQTTDISDALISNLQENNATFNLAGQRITHPTKGVYIVNGRKVILK